jgi:trigger factor
MQITQTNAEGLKRGFRIVIGAADIEKKIDAKLKSIGQQVTMPGFRPGKAPVTLIKRQYGRAVMGEVLEEQVNDATREAMEQHSLRPAMQPKVEVQKFAEGTDLEYTVEVEVLPDVVPTDFKQISLEKLVADIPDADVDTALNRLVQQQKTFTKVEEDRPAASGDAVVIDFVGKVDGVAFEGGTANDYQLQLGSNTFIPGFEDQLIGAKVGDAKQVNVTFPAQYGNKDLAGKAAVFDVTVKELKAAQPVVIDEDFAKKMGLDNLQALRDAVRKQIEADYGQVSRNRVKRALLDKLAESHDFPVPPGMLDAEFDQIWKQLQGASPEAVTEREGSGKSEDKLKTEYRGIAERRVRLGLLLAEVGRQNQIEVKPEEVSRAMFEQARRFPGQERQVLEFFRKNPEAADQLRAPIFEDKVVDFILELANVAEKKVAPADLMKEPEDETKAAS